MIGPTQDSMALKEENKNKLCSMKFIKICVIM